MTETVEYEGETYEIVPPKPETDLTKLTPEQSIAAGEIYKALSRMLPLEGRDYAIKIEFPDGDPSRPGISMKPMTELGTMWCEYVSNNLVGELRRNNQLNERG